MTYLYLLKVAFALPTLAALGACTMKEKRVELTPEVRERVRELDNAFLLAETDPPAFARWATDLVPKLREALDVWYFKAPGERARAAVRGWTIEAGIIETALRSLPPNPTAQDCRPIVEKWKTLRAKL